MSLEKSSLNGCANEAGRDIQRAAPTALDLPAIGLENGGGLTGHNNNMSTLSPTSLCSCFVMARSELPRNSVTTLLTLLRRLRVLPSRREATWGRDGPAQRCCTGWVTFCFNLYFLLVIVHAGLWVVEVLLGYVSVTRDASLNNLKSVLYNSRYGFMVFKSTFLLICLRWRCHKIVRLSKVCGLVWHDHLITLPNSCTMI